MNIEPRELLSVHDAARNLGAYIDRLERGLLRKVVVVRRRSSAPGALPPEPRAVLVTVEHYKELLEAAARGES